ncbi:MAG: GIY-YIG nuclease family protein [Bacteroidetes bacterium]|nr:GIY-YIG nuclease family protein [Bacteroidota bacterium]
MSYFVYILYSKSFDRFYIGQTSSLPERLYQHNAGKVRSTKAFIPWVIGHYERFDDRTQAIKRKSFLKSPAGWNELKALKQSIKNSIR